MASNEALTVKSIPDWVAPSVREALLSADPAAAVRRLAAEYRSWSRYVDANIAESQAAAFGVDIREEAQ